MVDGRVMVVELDTGSWRVTVMVDDGLVVVSREMDGGGRGIMKWDRVTSGEVG